MIFAVTSTMALNFFDERAARNRNAEAARAIVDDYVNYLLNDSLPVPPATGQPATDIDGDGIAGRRRLHDHRRPRGARKHPAHRHAGTRRRSTPVVTGTLYWRVQAVGTTYGCAADTDLVQVTFLLQYTYRTQTFYYKAMTFKANNT